MKDLCVYLIEFLIALLASLISICLAYWFLEKKIESCIHQQKVKAAFEDLLRDFNGEILLNYIRSLKLALFFEKQKVKDFKNRSSCYIRYANPAMYKFIFGAIHPTDIQVRLLYLIERMEIENRALDDKHGDDSSIQNHIASNKIIIDEISKICFKYINDIIKEYDFNITLIDENQQKEIVESVKKVNA